MLVMYLVAMYEDMMGDLIWYIPIHSFLYSFHFHYYQMMNMK